MFHSIHRYRTAYKKKVLILKLFSLDGQKTILKYESYSNKIETGVCLYVTNLKVRRATINASIR